MSVENAAARVRNPKWQVNFYFDRQNVLAPYALEYYQRAKVLAPPRLAKRLGDITFKSSAGVGALPAADMLAHACYRRASTPVGKRDELDMVTVRLRADDSSSYLPLPRAHD